MVRYFCRNDAFLRHLGIFYMPQICDMEQTALLPFWRKACWGFFRPKNRLRPGAYLRSWVPEASMLTTRPPKPLIPRYQYNLSYCSTELFKYFGQESVVFARTGDKGPFMWLNHLPKFAQLLATVFYTLVGEHDSFSGNIQEYRSSSVRAVTLFCSNLATDVTPCMLILKRLLPLSKKQAICREKPTLLIQ
jgi:hypothetical protein